jgi:hypothetical protein
MVEFNIYVMFKLCKLFFILIRSYMIIINHTFIIANRVTLLKLHDGRANSQGELAARRSCE